MLGKATTVEHRERADHRCVHSWIKHTPDPASDDPRPYEWCFACGSFCRRDKSGKISEYSRGTLDLPVLGVPAEPRDVGAKA